MSDEELKAHFDSLFKLITDFKESLEREIGEVKDSGSRMEARLDKIAAGAHYVTRLVEWSEKQDAFQADILKRVQLHGRQMAAGALAIAGWNDWTVKADEDYKRVLAELAELKLRLDKLDGGAK